MVKQEPQHRRCLPRRHHERVDGSPRGHAIWTETSIKSDWVRAEAGRAKAEGKLIPVKASSRTYADIPLPFGEMHTENVDATPLIRAAVLAQLAKPTVEPSAVWTATRTLRLQVLTWAGIVGGSITLFTNLRGLIGLADWTRWIVEHWHEWSQTFWKPSSAGSEYTFRRLRCRHCRSHYSCHCW